VGRSHKLLGRICTVENSTRKHCTRKKTTGTPKITIGRQGKRRYGKSETRRRLENNIIRQGKLEAIKLDDKVLKTKYHQEEEDI
jgi:hypothetical protein